MLDHMKLCHPEWLDELKEGGKLDDFIADHVDRAKDQYGRSVGMREGAELTTLMFDAS